MTDIVCPLCGKSNPPDLNECQYCQAPLKGGGFIAPSDESQDTSPFSEDVGSGGDQAVAANPASNLEQSIPDWLKETEASFMEDSSYPPEELDSQQSPPERESPINQPHTKPTAPRNAIDEEWLASLLVEAGAVETPHPEQPEKAPEEQVPEPSQEETELKEEEGKEEEPAHPTSPAEKPDWLTSLEASSKIKLEGEIFASEPTQNQPVPPVVPEEKPPEQVEPPEWLTQTPPKPSVESPKEDEGSIAPAELPGWLEALRPLQPAVPTGPVEDVSGADVVTAGPLMGLKGVISSHPSAIRAQKPPTYSIKLKITDEQQARLQMMEELLEDEGKSKSVPTKSIITSRYIFRLIVAIVLLLPMIWMIIRGKQQTAVPQPGNVPGVIDFTQQIQALPDNTPVLVAFDYEAGFSGELNIAITNVIMQLMKKNIYLTLVSTTPSGPVLAESGIKSASTELAGNNSAYANYANLGYIPGGTIGLLNLASSPKSILPYTLDDRNVWAAAPLESISAVKDFAAVIVITSDPDTARIWIEQVGPQLMEAGTPLLFITSAQAEPLVRPYYQAASAQVRGLIAGLTGGIAYTSAVGNYQQTGVWDAYSAGITISILIILVGSITGVILRMLATSNKKGI